LQSNKRRRGDKLEIRRRAGCREQGLPYMTVLGDVAERRPQLAMIEMQRKGRRRTAQLGVGHQDVVDRLGVCGQLLPDA
jgi:hypothetical protein